MAQIKTWDIAPFVALPPKIRLIWQLTKRDFQNRYTGSTLGIIWIFLQPIAMMTTLWLVFNFGLKAQTQTVGIPYAAWFFSAMVAWNFFSEAISSSNSALVDYSFLLKKVKFDTPLLPLVKILSAFIVHGIFLVLLFVVLAASRMSPDWSWLSLPVYTLWGALFALGLGFLTSSIFLFYRDIAQILGIVLQIGFWGTPVVWDLNQIPETYHVLFKLNPVSYMTEGYRSALLHHQHFWEFNPIQSIYAWTFCAAVLFGGFFVFQRLRPHFGDVI